MHHMHCFAFGPELIYQCFIINRHPSTSPKLLNCIAISKYAYIYWQRVNMKSHCNYWASVWPNLLSSMMGQGWVNVAHGCRSSRVVQICYKFVGICMTYMSVLCGQQLLIYGVNTDLSIDEGNEGFFTSSYSTPLQHLAPTEALLFLTRSNWVPQANNKQPTYVYRLRWKANHYTLLTYKAELTKLRRSNTSKKRQHNWTQSAEARATYIGNVFLYYNLTCLIKAK